MVNLCAGGTFKQINGEMWPTEQIKSKKHSFITAYLILMTYMGLRVCCQKITDIKLSK